MNDSSYFGPARDDAERDGLFDVLAECFAVPVEKMAAREAVVGPENIRVQTGPQGVEGGLWLLPMGQYYGARSVPTIGVAAVGISPFARGAGSAHRLMSAMLTEQYEAETALSCLYPATHRLYRRSGYELAGHWCEHTARIRDLDRTSRDLAVRPLTADDQDDVIRVYSQIAHRFPGYLDRGNYIWDRIQNPPVDPARGYGVLRDDRLVGYIYFTARKQTHGYDVIVPDLAFVDREAGLRVLSLVGDQGSIAPNVTLFGGPTHPFTHLIAEKVLDTRLRYYWMVRLVHLEAALTERGYPMGIDTEVHLEVADDILPGNADRFILSVTEGRGTVERGGKGHVRVDVRGLASLYTGFSDSWTVRLAGYLDCSDDHAEMLDGLFVGTPPAMADQF